MVEDSAQSEGSLVPGNGVLPSVPVKSLLGLGLPGQTNQSLLLAL